MINARRVIADLLILSIFSCISTATAQDAARGLSQAICHMEILDAKATTAQASC